MWVCLFGWFGFVFVYFVLGFWHPKNDLFCGSNYTLRAAVQLLLCILERHFENILLKVGQEVQKSWGSFAKPRQLLQGGVADPSSCRKDGKLQFSSRKTQLFLDFSDLQFLQTKLSLALQKGNIQRPANA